MNRAHPLAASALATALSMHAAAADGGSAPSASVPALPTSAALPPPPPSVPPPATSGSAAPKQRVDATCTEFVPAGKSRPKVVETVAARGTAGHALALELTIEHGKGERVYPNGFKADWESDALALFEKSQFFVPHPEGAAKPTKTTAVDGTTATTKVTLYFVPLPKKSGRHTLTLPPVPIAISRAGGAQVTLCTAPHTVVVEDPTANDPKPLPRGNPAPLRQLEVWEAAKQATLVALIALAMGALTAWLLAWWRRRPKKAVPAPPPRPPWEVALEELFDTRNAGLIDQERFDEHYDRVCNTMRKYFGDRYGFDFEGISDAGALESTTGEILSVLRRVVPPILVLDQIETFLKDADLVKFARLTPSAEDCQRALEQAERIVRTTVPETPQRSPGAARAQEAT